jgi:hypothetical protein
MSALESKKKKKSKKNDGLSNSMNKSGKLLVKAAMAYAARTMTSLKLNRPVTDNGKRMLKIYSNKNMY